MLFWVLTILLSAIALAALFYAARGAGVNMSTPADAEEAGRLRLADIAGQVEAGRLSADEAVTLRAELARELIAARKQTDTADALSPGLPRLALPLGLLATLAIAYASYAFLGNPSMPGQPLAARADKLPGDMSLDQAIAKVEAQLQKTPGDLRGWQVLAPVYLRAGRVDEAIAAYRRIIELAGATPDARTDLAEALLVKSQGEPTSEAVMQLQAAATADPTHLRSRFYLASLATSTGDAADAVRQWDAIIALSRGDEPWLQTAREGRAAAISRRDGTPLALPAAPAQGQAPAGLSPDQLDQVRGMVAGLAERLDADGGTIEEWTRLVRSYLVLGDKDAAMKAYEAARAAYPDTAARAPLDEMAQQAGLVPAAPQPAPAAEGAAR